VEPRGAGEHEPGREHVAEAHKNVSLACLALYLASRGGQVGRRSWSCLHRIVEQFSVIFTPRMRERMGKAMVK
jgi:hypothetical protein